MAERLCPSAFNRAERAMIEGAERRQRTLTGFPGASHVLSKLPFRTTPRCPVVLPRQLNAEEQAQKVRGLEVLHRTELAQQEV